MTLLSLPSELILHITTFLDRESDINALVQTARPLYNLLNHDLYKHNVRYRDSSGLAWAARHGCTSTVRMMLTEGARHDACGDEEWQPMCMAVIHGHVDVVRLFLQEGEIAQINHGDDDWGSEWVNFSNPAFDDHLDATKAGWDPLMLAVEHGQVSVARVLLEHGAKINETEILHASEKGVSEMMELFLEFNPELLDDDIEQFSGPLGYAAYHGRTEMVSYLLSIGMDADMSNSWGATPLAWAAHSGDLESARLLLGNGAYPDPALPSGLTLWPLRYAAERNHPEIAKLILDHINLESKLVADEKERAYLLVAAAACGWEDIVRRVLATGLHPDASGNGRNRDRNLGSGHSGTPLSWAIERGHAGVVEILLRHGANPDPSVDPNGSIQRLIVLAVTTGHEKIVELLLDWGVSPNPTQERESSLLVHAMQSPSILALLLERGADAGFKDYQTGKKPISFAIRGGNAQAVRTLVTQGSKIEASDDWLPWEIISDAVEGGLAMLELVSQYGILPDPRSRENHCIMKHALSGGQDQVVQYFLGHGFNYDEESLWGSVLDDA
ncbi:hypothetical protein N7492_000371 [Penicillium capsulatum]|uniref:F-box domain-containing protein n=1 Tax=Penicillium capsulatum TaxID=69766 RepID=A0A9W9LYX6_9EURO|nr:hypothetical protein N7492_000371 [Penicillium capsulatum]KAJ6130565.1 hypothetical protein N7512_003345 [Penicillium capsulatum]